MGDAEQWKPVIVIADGMTARLRHTGTDSAELEITGELDGPAVERLRAAIPLAASSRIVVDLRGVTFMASGGINWLVGLRRLTDQLLVRDPSPIVQRVLEVTGLADLLAIVEPFERGEAAGPPVARAD